MRENPAVTPWAEFLKCSILHKNKMNLKNIRMQILKSLENVNLESIATKTYFFGAATHE